MNYAALAGVLGYVVIQFAIGAWVSRRMSSEQDYIVAGRSLGLGLVAFSVFATWFGAEAIVSSAGEIYANGLGGGLVDPFGYGAAVVLVGMALAAPLWRRGIVTYADMVRQRFAPGIEKLFVVLLVPGSVFWASAQIRAFGQVLDATTGMSLAAGMLLAAVLVGAYSVVGGLLADAVTDVVQGLAVIIGLIVLVYFVSGALGGLEPSLARIEPQRLALSHGDGDGPWAKAERLAVVFGGSLVAVELVSRFLGARTATIAASGTVLGGLMYLAVGLLPLYLGLVGPILLPGLKETEQVVTKLAEAHLPPLAAILFNGALISAILSVVHAALHAPASQISHNIVVRLLPNLSAKSRLNSVRMCVLLLSVIAYLLANSVSHIKDLVELASAFGSAGALVVAMFGLFTRFGGPRAALAALLAGSLVWAWGKFLFSLSTPYLAGLAAAFAAYVIVALIEPTEAVPPAPRSGPAA